MSCRCRDRANGWVVFWATVYMLMVNIVGNVSVDRGFGFWGSVARGVAWPLGVMATVADAILPPSPLVEQAPDDE